VQRVADSFSWPFRASISRWIPGILCLVLLPLLFLPLLGYAVAATRAAEVEPPGAPPSWSSPARLLADGFWVALAILVTIAPFALLFLPLADALHGLGSIAGAVAFFVLALPWGLIALLLLPHATARFAASGRPRDLFDFAASLRGVRRDFATWNIVVGAIVTAWAIALACVALLCAGIVPGVFYAILVSAHACAALARQDGPGPGPDPSSR
jgi:hypothetical protein